MGPNKEIGSFNSAERRPFFKRDPLTSILLVIGVFFVSQVVAGVIISLYPSLKNWTSEQGTDWLQNSVYAQFAYMLIAESAAVWLTLKILKHARILRQRIGLVRPKVKDVAYALAGYGVYFICYIVIILVAGHFINLNLDQKQQIGFEGAGGAQLFYVYLSLAVLPPIAEEIMFRGFLFTSLRAKYRTRYAMLITSLLFGVAHLQIGSDAPLLWVAAVDTFVLSCVLCYLREKTGSLWASIGIHAIKNTIAFVAVFHTRF